MACCSISIIGRVKGRTPKQLPDAPCKRSRRPGNAAGSMVRSVHDPHELANPLTWNHFMSNTVNTTLPTRPTIKDVARTANVSQATVSYVLNDSKAALRISEGTKRRVRAAVERLGYRFNPVGRALQRGQTSQGTLLIVSWNLAISHAATAMAISRAAATHDLAL